MVLNRSLLEMKNLVSQRNQKVSKFQKILDMNTMPLIGDFNHLFIRQGTGLQGQAVFKTKLTFRPYSTNSLTHRKMMGRLAHRINHSIQKVRINTLKFHY